MDNEEINEQKRKIEFGTVIYVFRAVFLGIILLAAYILKTFFPTFFTPVKEWYSERFFEETKISDVLDNRGYSTFEEGEYSVFD